MTATMVSVGRVRSKILAVHLLGITNTVMMITKMSDKNAYVVRFIRSDGKVIQMERFRDIEEMRKFVQGKLAGSSRLAA